ncbi:MAG: cation:proton antiporter [candidate division Zixibacteria bacterium]|nr:cation:proton antiporter [candidate division Zixibacteria bacterium]MDH3936418.1 cation:proton antiporter [candidate division Zixibacteria bacterium]MDH4035092.1 cation:proton antiporter [candidate division Zixibacteria bacterium]
MSELAYLRDLVIILSFGVIIVTLFHRLRLPSIAGFIFSGLLVGPHGFGFISDAHQIEVLAEIGVALLLFGIGLELSLDKLRRLWRLIVVGGALQVGLTVCAAYAIARTFEIPGQSALFIGFVLALSSTAIVMRGLQQRGELDAPHGRLILGILVSQDFSVVPMMLAIPILVGDDIPASVYLNTMLRAVGIIIAVLAAALLIVPRILRFVARTRQRQLFILTVFLICIGTAWLITWSGASLAIGAFLAGLVVAGSEYRHQALADLIAFREVFASVFFVSIGMLLAPSLIVENIVLVLALLMAILIGKAVITFVAARLLRMPLRVCLMTAVALAQVGEFSFVLLFSVQGSDLIDKNLESSLVSAAILSMFVTPFAMSFGPRLAAGLGKLPRLRRLLDVDVAENATASVGGMRDHVIVGGYGFAGRELTKALRDHEVPLVVVDINIDNVKKASQEGAIAFFGDITSQSVLAKLGAECAGELVLLVNDPKAAEQAVRVARRLAPNLHIVVRTHYLLDIEPIISAGANQVVPSEREAAVEVTSLVLNRHQIDNRRIADLSNRIRSQSEDDV